MTVNPLIVYCSYMLQSIIMRYPAGMRDYPGLKAAIANTLLRLREAGNLSKRQMAQKAYLERVYIIQLEKGEKKPSVNALFYLCDALGIRPSDMMKMIEDELDWPCRND